jgi:hypothetical protein
MANNAARLVLIFLLLCSLVLACPQLNTSSIKKRWYGVGNPTGDEPRTKSSWPVTSPNVQPVRYCFVTKSDHTTLNALLASAIEKWQLAISQSALQNVTDKPSIDPDDPHLCSDPGVR